MSPVVFVLVATVHAAGLVAPQTKAVGGTRPYCGYSFAIKLTDDEVIQFTGSDKTTNYFAELREGDLKIVEHGPILSTAVEQRRLKPRGSIETLRLTEAARFLGYRLRDNRQGIDTLLTGSALDGSKRDWTLIDRFNFGRKRHKSCMRIRAVG